MPCAKANDFSDIVIAILRIIYLANTDYSPLADFTWASTETYLWSVIEPSLAVTVACSPILRPLLHFVFPKLKSTLYGRSVSKRYTNENYSQLSKSEVPLKDLRGFGPTKAGGVDSAKFQGRTTTGARASTPDSSFYEEMNEPRGIHIRSEVSVSRLANHS